MSAAAAWYADPHQPGTLRYWDGSAWTQHTAPAPPQAQTQTQAQAQTRADQSPSERADHIDHAPDRHVPAERTPSAQEAAPGQRMQPGEAGKYRAKLFGSRRQAEELMERNDYLEKTLQEIGGLDAAELEVHRAHIRAEISQLQAQFGEVQKELAEAREALVDARQQADLQDVGYYRFHHPAETSVELASALESVRGLIKEMVRDKSAATMTTTLTYEGSAAKGKKFARDMRDMMLAAYNAEAENAVKSVKAGNLATAVARLNKAAARIEKHGSMVDVRITSSFQRLRIRELELAADFYVMKEREKEAERARREELREQKKAEQEIARQKEKLEKERQHYENLIASLTQRGDLTAAEEAKAHLADTDRAIADVDYRAANMRAGYVYVISNVGAFGDGVVKIGMTRRLDPMDRVNELGDASVPFRFDVHTLFFSPDAVAVEAALHRHFADRRVNKVNLRREFFYATPDEVLSALQAQIGSITEFVSEPAAEEFRLSRGTADTSF